MAAQNIDRFNIQVLRAVAYLYGCHPAPVNIDHGTISAESERQIRPADDEWCASERGTILWLHKNGVVMGDLREHNPLAGASTAAIIGGQLTSRALRILNSRDGDLGGVLGEAAVAYVNGPQQDVAAKRIVKRLLEG